ncbi:MAG TPA: DUF5320 domain-containing protein [Candidatus Hydrogenedentes bacterium]|nr:MAG: hypothetical protein BWY07_00874 [Candidatus Hydrogenedentes bacterium ADurb.Bin170]HNZ47525.1 DUF5320 domain-containing protein [Candidatus Hydrogenedentota bacterium]HOD95198.1 DUF5320 domain-containing protein [Candidatus Hydrogenedentota bacterium]HOM47181.1 DUF5320 domain-containing protein [Candidatus Hydrogenedentota bacterium]HOR50545.1 DUF5320 domain-containing protein [Candidatus Hydrogenedentota bacterium]
MPGRDGTGPCGKGALTGRGAGGCLRDGRGMAARRGAGSGRGMRGGMGFGRGFGRGFGLSSETESQSLREQAARLQGALEEVQDRLASLEKSSDR